MNAKYVRQVISAVETRMLRAKRVGHPVTPDDLLKVAHALHSLLDLVETKRDVAEEIRDRLRSIDRHLDRTRPAEIVTENFSA